MHIYIINLVRRLFFHIKLFSGVFNSPTLVASMEIETCEKRQSAQKYILDSHRLVFSLHGQQRQQVNSADK